VAPAGYKLGDHQLSLTLGHPLPCGLSRLQFGYILFLDFDFGKLDKLDGISIGLFHLSYVFLYLL